MPLKELAATCQVAGTRIANSSAGKVISNTPDECSVKRRSTILHDAKAFLTASMCCVEDTRSLNRPEIDVHGTQKTSAEERRYSS
jgi:hypothetical protein